MLTKETVLLTIVGTGLSVVEIEIMVETNMKNPYLIYRRRG